jgi:hypothetical protein
MMQIVKNLFQNAFDHNTQFSLRFGYYSLFGFRVMPLLTLYGRRGHP